LNFRYADEVGLPQLATPREWMSFHHCTYIVPGRETFKLVHQKYENICRLKISFQLIHWYLMLSTINNH